MNILSGCELTFENAYFSQRRRQFIVKEGKNIHVFLVSIIFLDAPVQTLSVSTDVPSCAGSFAYPEDELDLQKRFIIW